MSRDFPFEDSIGISLVAQEVKKSVCNAGVAGDPGSIPWVRKIPWRREWQPTPVFLPGEFRGQRSLRGYSPLGHKDVDRTERPTHYTASNIQYLSITSDVIMLIFVSLHC